jgi:hypothetical protein
MSNGRKAGEPGAPFFSYVEEKRAERRLGRSIDLGGGGKSAAWGKLMEMYVFSEIIGLHYTHAGKVTHLHPTHDCWAGSADLIAEGDKVGDIKCYEPKNFVKLADVLMRQDREFFKSEFPKEYWQLVSNASIHQVKRAESILFMPFKSRLEDIRRWMDTDKAQQTDAWRYRFIFDGEDESLPYIPDGNEYYNELVTFEFEIPQDDFDALESRVMLANEYLNAK